MHLPPFRLFVFGFHSLQPNKEASLLILGLRAERISILSAERKTPADPAQGWEAERDPFRKIRLLMMMTLTAFKTY